MLERAPRLICAALGALALLPLTGLAEPGEATRADDARLAPAERIYREGLLPSGKPLEATLAGDIEVGGKLFACANCHLRSGLGSTEGSVVTPAINAPALFAPLRRGIRWSEARSDESRRAWAQPPPALDSGFARPAYTRESLARAIRSGIAAGGRPLAPSMPRYSLSDRDLALLIDYLAQLSSEFATGVSDDEIALATIVSDEIAAPRRQAMLSTLEHYVESQSALTRSEAKRARTGPVIHRRMYAAYRKLRLVVWELEGPSETWPAQLEQHYASTPVFALVGGLTTRDWAPVHAFCEAHRIPALFPLTERPVVSSSDWYTLYLSKGLAQEGEAAARWLHRSGIPAGGVVLQVYRAGGRASATARAFEAEWLALRGAPPHALALEAGAAVEPALAQALADRHPAALLLWLEREAAPALTWLAGAADRPRVTLVSSGLLGPDLGVIPAAVRSSTFATYPYALPGSKPHTDAGFERWLALRALPLEDARIQADVYLLGSLLSAAIKGMGRHYYREALLEQIDMMADQSSAVANYPRLSFGPGQRYASKGCYVVRAGPGPDPALEAVGEWTVQ